MHHSDTNQDKHMNGKYLVLDRPNKLVFTWYPCERDYETKVTLLFEKVSDGMTKMTLTQEGLRNEEDYKGHGEGWKACFDILEKFLKEGEGK